MPLQAPTFSDAEAYVFSGARLSSAAARSVARGSRGVPVAWAPSEPLRLGTAALRLDR